MAGYNLFDGKGNCNSCHLDGRSTAPDAGAPDRHDGHWRAADTAPLFTCFGYCQSRPALNPRDAFYYQTTPDFFGFTANPVRLRLHGFGIRHFPQKRFRLRAQSELGLDAICAATSDGQMQTSTARDVAMTPPQCPTTEAPGPYFQKEFFHNGYIKSLKQLVHFYNTRDVYPYPVTAGHCPAGTIEKVDCWPMPEVPQQQGHDHR